MVQISIFHALKKYQKKTKFLPIALYLLGLNLLSGTSGSYSPDFCNYFAFAALTAFFLYYAPFNFLKSKLSQNYAVFFLSLVAALLFFQRGTYPIIAAGVLILALDQNLKSQKREAAELPCLLRVTILYAIFLLVYQYASLFEGAAEKISRLISLFASYLIGKNINYGATYAGLHTMVLALITCLVVIMKKNKQRVLWSIGISLCIFVINIFYVVFHNWAISELVHFNSFLMILFKNSQLPLFLLLLPCIFLCLPSRSYIDLPRPGLNKFFFIALTTLLFIMYLPGFLPVESFQKKSLKVVFHKEGQVDWNIPVYGQYGGKNGGMFGVIIKHLNAAGYDVQINDISEESLETAAVLVLINSNRMFTEKEKRLIWGFVEKGGGLLVLGDHTGAEFIRQPFNDLLMPVGIGFNFDSAISMVPKWTNGFELKPHYITQNIRDENDMQIWIGASLTVSHPARSLILGKYAFSDKGNMDAKNIGLLGDMRYVAGEKLGDLALVAASRYKDGKVLVFGDTSSIQNSALFFSDKFIERVFDWLSMKGFIFYPYNLLFTTLAFLTLLLNVSLYHSRFHQTTTVFLIIFTLIVLIGTKAQQHIVDNKSLKKAPLAYIDASHLERFDLDAWGEQNGFGGLAYNLQRNGYIPLVMRHYNRKEVLNAKLLVIVAPAKPFTEDELASIDEFLNAGGNVILTVGWEDGDACRNLLQHFNLDLKNIPLGRITPDQNSKKISFHNAWPISHVGENVEIIARAWDYPVAVIKPHGKGRLLLVGDSAFLLNRNLEGLHNYLIDNILFLKDVLVNKLNRNGPVQ